MNTSFLKNSTAALFLAGSMQVAAQQVNIVEVYGQFVQTSYAASRCMEPDQDLLASFLRNFNIVSAKFTEELKKRSAGQSDEQIAARVKQAASAVEQAIDEAINTNGCSDPRIQSLLKAFETQANMMLEE